MAAYMFVAERQNRQKVVMRTRRNPLDDFTDDMLISEYRLPRHLILQLIGTLRAKLQPKSRQGNPLTTAQRVLICLKLLASGSFQNCAKDYINASQPAVSVIFDKFLDALGEKAPEYIYMPKNAGSSMEKFHDIAGFPTVIGAIDGTHIAIIAPPQNEHLYVGRKGYHSVNVQAVCDSDLIFLDISAKWPGATHDSFILTQSTLYDRFESGEFAPSLLLGDSGYPLKNWLLTPYSKPSIPNQEKFNSVHKKTRSVVERAFGVLKQRWRILDATGGHLCYSPTKVCKIFVCCAILHNICRRNNVPLLNCNPVIETEEDQDGIILGASATAIALRDRIANMLGTE